MEFIVWHIKGKGHGVAKILGLESQEIVVKTQFLSINILYTAYWVPSFA